MYRYPSKNFAVALVGPRPGSLRSGMKHTARQRPSQTRRFISGRGPEMAISTRVF